jgi:type II secretory pathway component PulF
VSTDKPPAEPLLPGDAPTSVQLNPLAPPQRGGLRLQHLMFAVVVFALLIWLAVVALAWLVTFSLVLLAACVVGLVVVVIRRDTSQQESLLWALAIAAERGLPLSPAAVAFADQFGAGFRWRCQMLAALLDEGKTLPEAIDAVPGLLSREAAVLVKTGCSTGRLAEALKYAASARQTRQDAWGAAAAGLTYLVTVVLAMFVNVGFVMYWIIPKFEAIFSDFGVPLPAMTIFTIKASHFVIKYVYVWFPLLVIALVALPFRVFSLFQWDVPLLDRLYRRRHSALLLRSLALSVRGGKPIVDGIASLGTDYPSAWVRAQLRKVDADVRNGGDWVGSLYQQGLIRPAEAAVLGSSQRVGNLEWALLEMASASDRRFGYRLQFWSQLLFPFVIVMLGLFVMVVTVSFFLPLVSLISRLSG